jgi:ribosomal protein L7Ae-like RNA K-turn-binding protein
MEAVKGAAGRAKLILLASDAGNSVKREAERLEIQIAVLPYTKEELGHAAGRGTCAIAAVADKEFSRGILEAINWGDLGEHSDQIPHT